MLSAVHIYKTKRKWLKNHVKQLSLSHLCKIGELAAHLLAFAALWVRIQTSLKIQKRVTEAKEWPTHCSPHQRIKKNKNKIPLPSTRN
jgi:hypothetical protein